MDYRLKLVNGLICTALIGMLSIHAPVQAKSPTVAAGNGATQRYIVILDDQPLATYDGRLIQTPERDPGSAQLKATANQYTGAHKLDVNTQASQQYLQFLDQRFKSFRGDALLRLGRQLKPTHRYRIALNGFATRLSDSEVQVLKNMPRVKAVLVDETQHLETDSGPNWIGADTIHSGTAGFAATGGEETVVGLIDSGINWDHLSFADPGPPGWDHVNPYPSQLGLCSDPEVLCNDKLVGVYDFVVDDPGTPEIEEYTKGKDTSEVGHGSHTGSTAVGNPLEVTLDNGIRARISGVAPNANIVSYRVCHDDGCEISDILIAIDQAITDGVDVINYSIGGEVFDPWTFGSIPRAFLNARDAGIFVATSASNDGPDAGTIGSPANAPWILAVGNASHDRVYGSVVENLNGGDTTPPDDLVGKSLTEGIGLRQIVHARDFGFPLCGLGEPELGRQCGDNTGSTNPWSGTPDLFENKIVVCDRGDYGRVEKGKNVMLAGASGYILANTDLDGESTNAEDHCLPAAHIGDKDGDELRTWLETGSGHQGSISGFDLVHVAEAGDEISRTSSRGPNPSPAEDVMKPDLIAPGTDILAASNIGSRLNTLSGTSMASPHVAGAAALLRAIHPDWTPSMVSSALMTTATPELAHDFDGSEVTLHKYGAGRPRLDLAANAGLYLDESTAGFLAADPRRNGDPGSLNLPGLIDSGCHSTCNFKRTVTDLVGGAMWTASVEVSDPGVTGAVSPDNFSLSNGAERLLDINFDVTQSGKVGSWVYGKVVLSSTGLPDAVLPMAIFVDTGNPPDEWQINSADISGSQVFVLDDLAAMPDATFTSGGLVVPTLTVDNLPQDPTPDTPYDGSAGVMTVWHTVAPETLWLHAETFESTSVDLDLFVGRDSNGDGVAQASEELCASTSPIELELCDLFTPVAGEYWILVQNWDAGPSETDEVTLESAVVGKGELSRLIASGNGIVEVDASQNVRLSWDNVSATPGTELLGAVGLGTKRESPNDLGVIPVRFTKTGIAAPETLVLMNGISRGLTISGSDTHDRIFVDIPAGIDSFTISSSATGLDADQNAALELELYRVDFDDAFANAPYVTPPDMSGGPLASATGGAGVGPAVTVEGASVLPGRWFVVLKNTSAEHASVEIKADLVFAGSPLDVQFGLWEPRSRLDIHQGIDFNSAGDVRAILWYTYDENGKPAWYQAAAEATDGNVWVDDLVRYTNDGEMQHITPAGHVSITVLGENDMIFSFVLFGENGSDRMYPLASTDCPGDDGDKKSYDGIWSRTAIGVGGATGLSNSVSEGFVHYIYDDDGNPVWLTAASGPQPPTSTDMSLLQWSGYCAACTGADPTFDTVGVFTRTFLDEENMNWTLDYVLRPPLAGSITRTDDTQKLTSKQVCQ